MAKLKLRQVGLQLALDLREVASGQGCALVHHPRRLVDGHEGGGRRVGWAGFVAADFPSARRLVAVAAWAVRGLRWTLLVWRDGHLLESARGPAACEPRVADRIAANALPILPLVPGLCVSRHFGPPHASSPIHHGGECPGRNHLETRARQACGGG